MDDIAVYHAELQRQRALARLDMFEGMLRSVAARVILAAMPEDLQRTCATGTDEEWDATYAAWRAATLSDLPDQPQPP